MIAIDRHALHVFLWSKRDRLGKVKLNQQQLADSLGVTKWTMSRVMHELIDDGRLQKVGSGYRFVATFVVRDPADFPDVR